MSSVSWAIFLCFSGASEESVRMLWSLSASFMRMTLMSRPMARTIWRKFSASWSAFFSKVMRLNLVSPSTSPAMSGPKSSSSFSRVVWGSSPGAWRSPVATPWTASFLLSFLDEVIKDPARSGAGLRGPETGYILLFYTHPAHAGHPPGLPPQPGHEGLGPRQPAHWRVLHRKKGRRQHRPGPQARDICLYCRRELEVLRARGHKLHEHFKGLHQEPADRPARPRRALHN